ncbi:MAG: DNA primase [Candidatus Zambryskibacteria bacterium CG10_big_fil_rev_8_21_14_0_10_42_12]|uniref:DNA primase n=1 Tax=Candidatus Zambryskibacteria bacterium CG10_big_fil_rev_8_21_14_0_10_42_12 TaxID=1975115 RepID=A0A2H0QUJ3_9BACT|nr:MAG: DNA primase [Candidatus Zambryskibacteria bacterium CG10_big_fil_rev_8_21_14_0_10_42_12]
MNDILRVKEKADIVDIISSYIELSKAGQSFKGNCPFHNEKTPSFFVSPERQNYYCFGCGAKGDVISFIEQYESLDFVGSLKLLAERVGVELTGNRDSGKRDEIARIYDVMEAATDMFTEWLSEHDHVVQYAKGRGLSDKAITDWRIGYAKDDWRALYDVLLTQKFTAKEMKDAGLIRDIEGKRVIDLFRNRLLFPIRDVSGRVIAFSGRTLSTEKDVPKYVNSPETHIFKKSSTLFGLYEAKQAIRKTGYTILVEGQMDVLMLHEKGLRNTVASSGTAFTSEQARMLKRISPKLVLLYDGDGAGKDASLRAAQIALGVGIETKIARMPEGVDPADMAQRDPDALKEVLQKADHAIFVAARMVLEVEPKLERRVSLITKNVLPLVHFLESESLKDHFIQELSRMLSVSREALWNDLQRIEQKGFIEDAKENGRASPHSVEFQGTEASRFIKILRQLYGIESWLTPEKDKQEIVTYIQQHIARILTPFGEEEKNNFIEKAHDEGSAFEAEKFYNHVSDKEFQHIVDDLLNEFHKEALRTQYEVTRDPQQRIQISKEIDILKTKH